MSKKFISFLVVVALFFGFVPVDAADIPTVSYKSISISKIGNLKRVPPSRNTSEQLSSNFVVVIEADKKKVFIPKTGGFKVVVANPNPISGTPEYGTGGKHLKDDNVASYIVSGADSQGDFYVIDEYKKATFTISSSFNPLQMFAGRYYAYIYALHIGNQADGSDQVFKVLPTNYKNNKSNIVVLVGERSPYITDILPGKFPSVPGATWNSKQVINGMRFSATNNQVKISSASSSQEIMLPSWGSGTKITVDTSLFAVPSGNYSVTVKSNGMLSNEMGMYVKGGGDNAEAYINAEFVGSDVDVMTGDSVNDDTGVFTIEFNISAHNSDIYIPAFSRGYNYVVYKNGVPVNSRRIFNSDSISYSDGSVNAITNNGNFLIPEGKKAKATISVVVPLGDSLTEGNYKVVITGIRWGTADDSVAENLYTDFANFEINNQHLNTLPQQKASWTANIWQAVKGFFE